MVAGWRRAFCTSPTMPKDRDPKVLLTEKHQDSQQHGDCDNTHQSPTLSCRTSMSNSSLPNSPNLQCNNNTTSPTRKKNNSPRWFHTPNSPSSYYSLLKATLRLSKSVCGICTKNVKTGEGKAIFTAECSHIFHFPCIAAHVKKQQMITCPVCGTNWNDLQPEKTAEENTARNLKTTKPLKVHNYNDDEPLLSPISVSRFNTIPESDENEAAEEEDEENKEPTEFQSFSVSSSSSLKTKTFDAFLLPQTASVASNRNFETIVAVLKVKANPCNVVAHRPPVDIVTVIDVGGLVSGEELLMLKRSMEVMISSLGSADRLSVVAFSGGSKRLFPLSRMTGRGRRAARRVMDTLTATENTCDGAPARKEALKKAAKVLEDRRQRNPVAKIILLSNGYEDRRLSSSRFSHLEIPVHALSYSHKHQDGAFVERVGSLLRVVAQDLRLELRLAAAGEITAVYSPGTGFTAAVSPGSAVLGDLHAAEERELLVELKLPSSRGSHNNVLSVQSSHRDPFTQEVVYSKERAIIVPRPCPVGSLDPKTQRLIWLHVCARASMKQLSRESVHEWLRRLEAEEAESRLRGRQQLRSPKLRSNNCLEEKLEPLTPMSAWRAAERLAKVAIMRKSMNKVSDLHGFEDARF